MRRLTLILALVSVSACATLGSLVPAHQRLVQAVATVQLAADLLEADGLLTPAERAALSPTLVRLAEGAVAIEHAIAAGQHADARARAAALLQVVGEVEAGPVLRLSAEARAGLRVAVRGVRVALVLVQAGQAGQATAAEVLAAERARGAR